MTAKEKKNTLIYCCHSSVVPLLTSQMFTLRLCWLCAFAQCGEPFFWFPLGLFVPANALHSSLMNSFDRQGVFSTIKNAQRLTTASRTMQSTGHTAATNTYFSNLLLTTTRVRLMNWHTDQKTQGVLPWRRLILADNFKSPFEGKFIRCGKPEKSWSPHSLTLFFICLCLKCRTCQLL